MLKKMSSLKNKESYSESIYGDRNKYLTTKIKSYEGKINTNFQGKAIPKENRSYRCLSLIMLDSFIRVNKKCRKILLEE